MYNNNKHIRTLYNNINKTPRVNSILFIDLRSWCNCPSIAEALQQTWLCLHSIYLKLMCIILSAVLVIVLLV